MRIAAVGLLLLSAPVWAGDMYSFTLEKRGGLDAGIRRGRVLVDGNRYRLEYDPEEEPRSYDVAISKDAGEAEIFFLHLASRTYYKKQRAELESLPIVRVFWLYSLHRQMKRDVRDVRLEVQEAPAVETVSGQQARRHEIRISYGHAVKYSTETLRVKVKLEVVSWLLEDRSLLLPNELRLEPRMALPEVDGPLSEALSKVQGFPVKRQVTITTDVEKGISQTYVTTLTVHDLKPAQMEASQFEIPSGFTYQTLELTAPGTP